MNTARAFGPAAVQGFPNGSHWIVRWHLFQPSSPTGVPYVSPRTCFSHFGLFLHAIARGKKKNEILREREKGKRPLDPHLSPHVLTRLIKKAMLTTHVAPIS